LPLEQGLERLKSDKGLGPNFVEWRHIPASPPTLAPVPAALDGRLAEALARRGIERLYSHQAEAVEAVLAGRNAAVVTPTASGKTLCYNLPVLQTLLSDPNARTLYLFSPRRGWPRTSWTICTASSPRSAPTSRRTPTTATRPPTPVAPSGPPGRARRSAI